MTLWRASFWGFDEFSSQIERVRVSTNRVKYQIVNQIRVTATSNDCNISGAENKKAVMAATTYSKYFAQREHTHACVRHLISNFVHWFCYFMLSMWACVREKIDNYRCLWIVEQNSVRRTFLHEPQTCSWFVHKCSSNKFCSAGALSRQHSSL